MAHLSSGLAYGMPDLLLAGIVAIALHAGTAIFAGAATLALTSALALHRAHQARTAEDAHQPGQPTIDEPQR